MAQRDGYEPGTPNWVDLMTTDVDAAKTFYTGLFGWTAEDQLDGEGTRIYTNLRKDGKLVCGMGGQMPGMAGMPPVWNTYICTDDITQTTKLVEVAGGTVTMPPMQVVEEGSMAIYGDPSGAAFSVWQPGNHKGAEVVNEPGAYAWNELVTRDIDAARPFYSEVFGWAYDEVDMGPMGTYYVVKGGEEGGLAGLMGMPPEMPEEVPNHWGVYFMVADAQATMEKAGGLGGLALNGPDDSPVGILATIQDPQGGSFSILQPPSRQ